MLTTSKRILAAALTSAAMLAMLVPAALAAPEPCPGGYLITDPPGDQAHKQQGVTVFATPASTDVIGLFFRVDGDKVTANIVVSELAATPPSPWGAVRYRAYGTVDGEVHYFEARVASGSTTYSYGGELPAVAYTQQGLTTGALFEGKPGIIQIVLPPAAGGKPGTELAATSATAGLLSIAQMPAETHATPIYFQGDTAPDGSADGPDTKPASCAATVAAPPAPAPAAVKPVRASSVRVTLARATLSAKKSNAKRAASLVLKASEALTGVSAQLMRGKAVVGTGTLAKLSGKGTLKLKLKGKLKKGAHKLVVSGKRADGKAVTVTLKITVSA